MMPASRILPWSYSVSASSACRASESSMLLSIFVSTFNCVAARMVFERVHGEWITAHAESTCCLPTAASPYFARTFCAVSPRSDIVPDMLASELLSPAGSAERSEMRIRAFPCAPIRTIPTATLPFPTSATAIVLPLCFPMRRNILTSIARNYCSTAFILRIPAATASSFKIENFVPGGGGGIETIRNLPSIRNVRAAAEFDGKGLLERTDGIDGDALGILRTELMLGAQFLGLLF